tara:strand:+ start:162343 stop:163020 length:678 start_codon:yes stop_codon:yes gene_type:complete
MDLLKKIKSRLDNYLEFDSDELFKSSDPIIFGGAIRDSICEDPIHDVDILAGGESARHLHHLVLSKGYFFMDSLVSKDIQKMYSGIRVISAPKTYVKNGKIIQIITPTASPKILELITNKPKLNRFDSRYDLNYEEVIEKLISEVDLSCCGVSYNGKEVRDRYPNAIIHSMNKVFTINENALMKTNRFEERRGKLMDRGWSEITEDGNRELILDYIINNNNEDYE